MLRLTLAGALRAGDRIISARKLAEREQVSLPTALEALRYLEAEGLIIARPRSGYFVRQPAASGNEQRAASLPGPVPVTMSAIARSLFGSAEARLVPLGAALPDPAWLPVMHYSGRCTPPVVGLMRAGRATACPREERTCAERLPHALRSGALFLARMTLSLRQAQPRRYVWRSARCASRAMLWRLSSPPTSARFCCWKIWV
jgi:hypothetical protein